jgi:hypothetical protein
MQSQTIFVLKSKEYSDRDLFLYTLSEDGYKNFIARGVRRINSSFSGKISGFGFVECGIIKRKSQLDYIVEAKKNFLVFPGRENMDMINSLARILQRMAMDREEFWAFFDLWTQNYKNGVNNLLFWIVLFCKQGGTFTDLHEYSKYSYLISQTEILLDRSFYATPSILNFINRLCKRHIKSLLF